MSDIYQQGNDLAWTKHANEELQRDLKKKNRQLGRWQLLCLLLLLVSAWVVYRYAQHRPVQELWDWKALPLPTRQKDQ